MRYFIDVTEKSALILSPKDIPSHCQYAISLPGIYRLLSGNISKKQGHPIFETYKPHLMFLGSASDLSFKKNHLRMRIHDEDRYVNIKYDELKDWLHLSNQYFIPFQDDFNKPIYLSKGLYNPDNSLNGEQQLFSKPDGIAYDASNTVYSELLSVFQTHDEFDWFIHGNLSYQLVNELKKVNKNLAIELNTPLRLALKGIVYSDKGEVPITDKQYAQSQSPLKEICSCDTCLIYTQSYLHHLYLNTPVLAIKLLAKHNLSVWIE